MTWQHNDSPRCSAQTYSAIFKTYHQNQSVRAAPTEPSESGPDAHLRKFESSEISFRTSGSRPVGLRPGWAIFASDHCSASSNSARIESRGESDSSANETRFDGNGEHIQLPCENDAESTNLDFPNDQLGTSASTTRSRKRQRKDSEDIAMDDQVPTSNSALSDASESTHRDESRGRTQERTELTGNALTGSANDDALRMMLALQRQEVSLQQTRDSLTECSLFLVRAIKL